MPDRWINAGNLDHISPVRDAAYPVRCQRRDGKVSDEWVSMEYAVDRLSGYYRDDPQGWIESSLRDGAVLMTVSFLYSVPREA